MSLDPVAIATLASGVLGALATKLFDRLTLRFGRKPATDQEFRQSTNWQIKALQGQVAFMRRELRVLQGHVTECEQDRIKLREEVANLKLEKENIERKLTRLEAIRQ